MQIDSYETVSESEIYKTSKKDKGLSDNRLNIPFKRHWPTYVDREIRIDECSMTVKRK